MSTTLRLKFSKTAEKGKPELKYRTLQLIHANLDTSLLGFHDLYPTFELYRGGEKTGVIMAMMVVNTVIIGQEWITRTPSRKVASLVVGLT